MRLIAIGNALLDMVAFVDADFPETFGYQPNTTTHMSPELLSRVIPYLPHPWISAGGGAANTARVARLLGLEAAFFGMVGDDRNGRLYREDLKSAGIGDGLSVSSSATGVFCGLIDPRGRRTLLVAPGAAPEVVTVVPDFTRRSGDIFYIDGFLLSHRNFFESEAKKAREAGMLVAIDLGSARLTLELRELLLDSIPRLCDFVFANEDEFLALSGLGLAGGLALFSSFECAFIIKQAERGAIYAKRGIIRESPVRSQVPIDETGAGDAFSGAFLVGLARGLAPERCLRLGNRIAEEAIAIPAFHLDHPKIRAAGQSVLN